MVDDVAIGNKMFVVTRTLSEITSKPIDDEDD